MTAISIGAASPFVMAAMSKNCMGFKPSKYKVSPTSIDKKITA